MEVDGEVEVEMEVEMEGAKKERDSFERFKLGLESKEGVSIS